VTDETPTTDRPTKDYSPVSEFVRDLWDKCVKAIIDFKGYLKQRRKILRDPSIVFDPAFPGKGEQSPLQFAVQGMIAIPLMV
jgi:hypothetical protein